MPLALDPDEQIDLILASDQAKPEAKRVTFTFTHLPARKFRELQRLISDAIAAADAEKPDDEDSATANALLLGLKSFKLPADGDANALPAATCPLPALIECLTIEERWELLIEWRKALTLGAAEKKVSPSPSPSDTASSAPPAATADATPSPAPPSPSCFPTEPAPSATAEPGGCNAPIAAAGGRMS